MKFMFYVLCLSLFFAGCKDAIENSITMEDETEMTMDDVFNKISETGMANLKGWQNENLDYSMYADNFVMLDISFGVEKDSISLTEMMESDKMLWKNYDFKLMTDSPVLLTGINRDGSVRHYSDWEVKIM